MSDDEMRKLDVPSLQDEGYIFLWVTGRSVPQQFCWVSVDITVAVVSIIEIILQARVGYEVINNQGVT